MYTYSCHPTMRIVLLQLLTQHATLRSRKNCPRTTLPIQMKHVHGLRVSVINSKLVHPAFLVKVMTHTIERRVLVHVELVDLALSKDKKQ